MITRAVSFSPHIYLKELTSYSARVPTSSQAHFNCRPMRAECVFGKAQKAAEREEVKRFLAEMGAWEQMAPLRRFGKRPERPLTEAEQ